MCGGVWEVQGKRETCRIIWGDRNERSHLEDLGIIFFILLLITNQKTLYIHSFYRLIYDLDCQWARRGTSDTSLVYFVKVQLRFRRRCLAGRSDFP